MFGLSLKFHVRSGNGPKVDFGMLGLTLVSVFSLQFSTGVCLLASFFDCYKK